MSKYEYLKNAQGNIDREYRVHLEVFSNDRPPEYFLKALAGGQEEHGFQVIDGSDSTGVLETENAFFKDILRSIDTNHDGQLSENELEKVIAKHPSEWHFEEQVENSWFNNVLEKGRDLLEQHASKYFQSEEIFQQSPYREKIMSLYDKFTDHEKERIEQTAWIQKLDATKLKIEPQVWHFWPLVVTSLLDDEMDLRWLTVSMGQITFNAEGNDKDNSIHFSRKIHWPGNNNSGVTIGRGYDLGERTEQSVINDLMSAGISEVKSKEIAKAAGKKGTEARDFVNQNKNKIGEITRKQQNKLFNFIYPDYVRRGENNYNKWTSKYNDRTDWSSLDDKIKDILVDFVYQGFTKGGRPMEKGMKNNKQELITYIETNVTMKSYENGRQRAKYLRGE